MTAMGKAAIHSVTAFNMSAASENKIHDDAVARRLGFTGALVPGVEVYAYACHAFVRRWGMAWLEHGRAECRFLKPVYDGNVATVRGRDAGVGMTFEVESAGVSCATGLAAPTHDLAAPIIAEWPDRPPPATRPAASEDSLAPGTWLGIAPLRLTAGYMTDYLRGVGETEPLYQTAGLTHPGLALRACNMALTQNVVLGPWIHVGSQVRNFAAPRVGDALSVRARVAANYGRKGHRLVDLDALVVANGGTVVAQVLHTAVWQPRQAAATA